MTNAENETKTIKTTYLTSNYFVRNGNSSKPFTLTYGNENSSITMPAGKAIYANVLGTNVPLGSGGGGAVGFPDYSKATVINYQSANVEQSYTAPSNGWMTIHLWGDLYSINECYIKVNNRKYFFPQIGTTEYGITTDVMLPVSKGDKVTFKAVDNSAGTSYGGYPALIHFIPCKTT